MLAAILSIDKTMVQQREQCLKRPGGPAPRRLDLIEQQGLAPPG
jgi:DNA-binding transcriptional regulator YiaG